MLVLEIALAGSVMATQTRAADLDLKAAPSSPASNASSWGTRASSPSSDVVSTGLTGDWNGQRTWLFNHGVDIQAWSVNQVASNVVSGSKTGVASNGENGFAATFDLRKLLGLDGARFQVSVAERYGNEIGASQGLGLLMEANDYYGRGDIVRLGRFGWEQAFFGNALNLKLGRLLIDDDFAGFNCAYQNLTFCGAQPKEIDGNFRGYPASQWGARLRGNFGSAGYVEAGVYEINERDIAVSSPFNFNLNPTSGSGVLVPVEAAWTPTFANGALPGSYKITGWYDSTAQADVFDATLYQSRIAAGLVDPATFTSWGSYGVSLGIRQQLTPLQNGSKQGLSGFLNYTYIDPRTSTINNQFSVGLSYTGLLPGRPNDELNFAFGRTHENNSVASAQAILNSLGVGPGYVQGTESTFELNYGLEVTKGLVVRPNVQYILDPGGISDHKNVVVLGLMTVANF